MKLYDVVYDPNKKRAPGRRLTAATDHVKMLKYYKRLYRQAKLDGDDKAAEDYRSKYHTHLQAMNIIGDRDTDSV